MESPEEIDREAARCKDEKKKADTFVLWRQVSTGRSTSTFSGNRTVMYKLFERPLLKTERDLKYGAKVLGQLCDSRTSYISSVTISASANNFLS